VRNVSELSPAASKLEINRLTEITRLSAECAVAAGAIELAPSIYLISGPRSATRWRRWRRAYIVRIV